MEAESSSPVLISARHQILKKKFQSIGVRRLLVACSREVESLPYNLERALDEICDVTKVGSILSKVEHIIEEQSLDVLSKDSSYTGDLQEKIITVKKDEIASLKNLLEKAKKSNNEMRSRLDELKKNQDLPSALDAVEKVLDSLSLFMPTLDLASEILLQFLMEHALGFILGFRFKQNFMEFQ
ncbi:hypothetical protein FCM35_KLT02292 [Carex littledalei]|uniref:Uncharacterized protein n=1 Tax=Carex littledalei TaxID=544730 RepID=A0A833VME7_9POAL|nr:hypothetical protein FCM35_KLT02292 [Carex littledalei]